MSIYMNISIKVYVVTLDSAMRFVVTLALVHYIVFIATLGDGEGGRAAVRGCVWV